MIANFSWRHFFYVLWYAGASFNISRWLWYIYIYVCVCVYIYISMFDKLQFRNKYEIDEHILKNFIEKCSPYWCSKKRLIIYYNKFETSNLIISNNSFPFTELLDGTNVIYSFKCPLGDWVSNENNTYVGLTRRLTMHLNDSSSITIHLKTHSIPKSKFRKILIQNTTIIAHKINKQRLQIFKPHKNKNKNKTKK